MKVLREFHNVNGENMEGEFSLPEGHEVESFTIVTRITSKEEAELMIAAVREKMKYLKDK